MPAGSTRHSHRAAGGKARSYNDMYECEFIEDGARWTAVDTTNAPPPRTRHAAVALDDRYMFMFGGVDKRTRFNDVWLYDTQHRSWSAVEVAGHTVTDESGIKSVVAPGPRAHFTSCKFFDKIFVFGGYGGAGTVYGDLWVLHTSSASDGFQMRCADICMPHAVPMPSSSSDQRHSEGCLAAAALSCC
jgi:dynein heavy chain, axonemal